MTTPASSSIAPPDPHGPPHVRVEMLSCPRFLAGAREMVASLARRLGFDDVGASQVALAVDEALANVIRHGYDRREDQPIWMMIWQLDPPAGQPTQAAPASAAPAPHAATGPASDPASGTTGGTGTPANVATSGSGSSGLRIVIEDLGRQIEPSDIKGRDLDDIRPGGLGVHIIKEVMDEVAYEKRPGGGMRLTLVKRAQAGKDRSVDHAAGHSPTVTVPPGPGAPVGGPSSPSSNAGKSRGNVHG